LRITIVAELSELIEHTRQTLHSLHSVEDVGFQLSRRRRDGALITGTRTAFGLPAR